VAEALKPIARFSTWAHLRRLRERGRAVSVDTENIDAVWEANEPVSSKGSP
jgi:hypothetical protein